MGKIGDLWAKLSLKKDEFDKGIDSAKKNTKGFKDGLKEMSLEAKALWASIGVAVVKMAKEFINSSQIMGDAFANMVSGMKSQASAGVNFITRLFNGMSLDGFDWKGAKASGRLKSMAKDALFEVENAFQLEKSKVQPRLNELYLQLMNTGLSDAARKAAADEYLSILEPLYDRRAKALGQFASSAAEDWAMRAGLGNKYDASEIAKLIQKMGEDSDWVQMHRSDFYEAYQSMGDAATKEVVDAYVAFNNATAELGDSTKRIQRIAQNLGNGRSSGGGSTKEEPNLLEEASKSIDDYVDKLASGAEKIKSENEALFDEIEAMGIELEFEIPPIDWSKWEASEQAFNEKLAEWVENYKEEQQKIKDLNKMINTAITDSISGGIQAMAESLVSSGKLDATTLLTGILEPFARTGIQLGEMLIAQGLAVEAFKKSLESLQGVAAIAAGAALIAVSSAAMAGIKALGAKASGGVSTSASSGGASSVSTQDINTEMTIYVKGKIDGKDILLASDRARNYYGR